MKLIRLLVLVCVITGFSELARADAPAGSSVDIRENCQRGIASMSSGDTTFQMGICVGFFSAVMLDVGRHIASDDKQYSCFPSNLQTQDAIKIFIPWAEAHPEVTDGDYAIRAALKDHFACDGALKH